MAPSDTSRRQSSNHGIPGRGEGGFACARNTDASSSEPSLLFLFFSVFCFDFYDTAADGDDNSDGDGDGEMYLLQQYIYVATYVQLR